jgi:hypothetical protein
MSEAALLSKSGLPLSVCELVVELLRDRRADLRIVLNNYGGSPGAVAIKNDDIKSLQTVAALVVSAAGGAAMKQLAPAALAALVVFLFDFHKKKINLNVVQAMLLRHLKQNPNATRSEIDAVMRIASVSAETVDHELERLAHISRSDGVEVCLVSKDTDGRWHTVDI